MNEHPLIDTHLAAIAASYARYSSDLQDEQSILDQQRKCRDRAAQNGHEITLEFADRAVSGAKHDRAGFQDLLERCRRGEVNVLYFESLSRFSRDSLELETRLRELVGRYDVRVISIDDALDTSSPAWRLQSKFQGYMAEEYLATLGKQVLRGQSGLARDGYSVGDQRFGYKSVPAVDQSGRAGRDKKPKMVHAIDEEQANWIRWVFERFNVDLWTAKRISKELNRLGVRRDARARSDHWKPSNVTALLGCEKYAGRWLWGKKQNVRDPLSGKTSQRERSEVAPERVRRYVPELAIVDPDTFAAAQVRLEENRQLVAGSRGFCGRLKGSVLGMGEPSYLLSGVLVCGQCGGPMIAFGNKTKYFKCKANLHGGCPCGTQVPIVRVEHAVIDAIRSSIFAVPEVFDDLLERLVERVQEIRDSVPNELNELEGQLPGLKSKVERLIDLAECEDVPDIGLRIREHRRSIDQITSRIESLRSKETKTPRGPTATWAREQLRQLSQLLGGEVARANPLIKSLLVGNKVTVWEVDRPGYRRKGIRATLEIDLDAPLKEIAKGESPVEIRAPLAIELDLSPSPPKFAAHADEIVSLWRAGASFKVICETLRLSKTLVGRAFKHWHKSRGLPVPDGRGGPPRLGPSDYALQRQDEIKQLYEDGLLLVDIAEYCGLSTNAVRDYLAGWYSRHGLPVPDGRTRRKELAVKARQPRDDDDQRSTITEMSPPQECGEQILREHEPAAVTPTEAELDLPQQCASMGLEGPSARDARYELHPSSLTPPPSAGSFRIAKPSRPPRRMGGEPKGGGLRSARGVGKKAVLDDEVADVGAPP